MTCFWTGLIKAITPQLITTVLKCNPSPQYFINALKQHNHMNYHVNWQDSPISQQQKEEIFIHIQEYDVSKIYDGYFCSCCDPFIILISHVFQININHTFNGYLIKYTIDNPKGTINIFSNMGHFWA